MVIITYFKPNLLIQSDTLMSGKVCVFDSKNHKELLSVNVFHEDFVSIKAMRDWPKDINIEIDTGKKRISKQIII